MLIDQAATSRADKIPRTTRLARHLRATGRVREWNVPREERPYTAVSRAPWWSPARLMLALLERLVTDAGGTYVFCDTDSMAIVERPSSGEPIPCPTPDGSGGVTGLDRPTIEGILARFGGLSPYEPDLTIPVWKAEHDSLARPVTCYAISAKRYLLYRASTKGTVPELVDVGDDPDEGESADSDELTDWSEHGLGLYLAPVVNERGRPTRDAEGRRLWVRDAWRWVLRDALGDPVAPLPWADLPAVTRFTISSPAIAGWFRGRDAQQPRADQIHPGGFGLLAHPAELDNAARMPAGPYETNPERWIDLDWYDRHSGHRVRLITDDPVRAPERFASAVASGALRVRTLGEILATYGQRPEHKSLAPDASPASMTTVGLMRRRQLSSDPTRTRLAGKEGNKLVERLTGVVTDPADYRTDYGTRADSWTELVVPVLRQMGASEVAQRTNPAWRRSIERIIDDGHRPRSGQRVMTLMEVVIAYAMERPGTRAGVAKETLLGAYLAQPEDRLDGRVCACGCGLILESPRVRWFNEAHRKREGRRRRA